MVLESLLGGNSALLTSIDMSSLCIQFSSNFAFLGCAGDGYFVPSQVRNGQDCSVRTCHPAADRTCGWTGKLFAVIDSVMVIPIDPSDFMKPMY